MDDYIITNTGKQFEVQNVNQSSTGINYVLYVELIGMTIADVAITFSNPEETQLIKYYRNEELEKEYRGFTNLTRIATEYDTGNINITLAAPNFE